jgi:hypothetical protein
MNEDLKFEQGDLVLCEHWGESYRAHIDRCPRLDSNLKVYQIRICGGLGLTHALEENLTLIKPKRDIKNSVNYKSKK